MLTFFKILGDKQINVKAETPVGEQYTYCLLGFL